MITIYDALDNVIRVSVFSDSKRLLYAECFIMFSGFNIDDIIIHNYSLNQSKFRVFCRSMVNASIDSLKKRVGCVEPDPELDFELR